MSAKPSIDIVIPTYQRGDVILQTIDMLSKQVDAFNVMHIVDQTHYDHSDPVAQALARHHETGDINWLRLDEPSIPNAMNQGLLVSKADCVLFLDDDILPSHRLLAEHLSAMLKLRAEGKHCVACVGQILQPNEQAIHAIDDSFGKGFTADFEFPFNSTKQLSIQNCMAGNLLVDRHAAVNCGGFDCHFEGVAYRFETEFCRRLIKHSQGEFYFSPEASLKHLKLERGGTRSKVVNFLKSSQPDHSMGEYYFILRHAQGFDKLRFSLKRYFGSIKARFYLFQPWWIPIRLIGELRGFLAALRLSKQPARLINS